MEWKDLNSLEQLDAIVATSSIQPVLLFKHSTRCSISSTALNRLERSWNSEESNDTLPYYLDLIAHRDISQAIATRFGIEHQSPQALVIRNGVCIYHASHFDIQYAELLKQLA
jgi:bacillithiol system protein YtxJ